MGWSDGFLACLTLQPERADAERVARAVAPLPAPDASAPAATDPAVLKKRPVDLLADAGGIKAAPASGTLLATLGGYDAVAAIVDASLQRATADWRVKRFLPEPGTPDAAAVRTHMEGWLAAAFGSVQYTGPDPAAYAGAKEMTGTHIDTLAQHVAGAMLELGMPSDAIAAAVAEIAAARKRGGLP